MLWNNQPFCTLCKLSCDWFKKADWPIAGQDKENQMKDTGKKRVESEESPEGRGEEAGGARRKRGGVKRQNGTVVFIFGLLVFLSKRKSNQLVM